MAAPAQRRSPRNTASAPPPASRGVRAGPQSRLRAAPPPSAERPGPGPGTTAQNPRQTPRRHPSIAAFKIAAGSCWLPRPTWPPCGSSEPPLLAGSRRSGSKAEAAAPGPEAAGKGPSGRAGRADRRARPCTTAAAKEGTKAHQCPRGSHQTSKKQLSALPEPRTPQNCCRQFRYLLPKSYSLPTSLLLPPNSIPNPPSPKQTAGSPLRPAEPGTAATRLSLNRATAVCAVAAWPGDPTEPRSPPTWHGTIFYFTSSKSLSSRFVSPLLHPFPVSHEPTPLQLQLPTFRLPSPTKVGARIGEEA